MTPQEAAQQITARRRAEEQRVREIENENRRLRKLLAASARRTARRDEKLRAAREETARFRNMAWGLKTIAVELVEEKAQFARLASALTRQRTRTRQDEVIEP